jgi:hypothetical protein
MIDLAQLKPYKSLIITKGRSDVALTSLVNEILDDLVECLEIGSTPKRQLVNRFDVFESENLTIGILYYREECQPSWTFEVSIQDTINHLIIIFAQHQYVSIFLSDPKRKHQVMNEILQEGDHGLKSLGIISQGLLNAAFVKGPTRTLWLSGTHRQTSIKPDNKILSGLDLRDALDPLGDQTYHFTAARCVPVPSVIPEPVGISPRKSQVWTGPSKTWDDFRNIVSKILLQVESTTTPIDAPLPVIAISSPEVGQVFGPFDIAIVPPELLSDDSTIDDETRQEMELWGYQSNFEIVEADENKFITEVSLSGQILGKIEFELDLAPHKPISWKVSESSCESGQEKPYDEALKLVQRKAWVKIWFESGHTISNGEIFEVRHRDMPFVDITWADLSGYQVKKEKPEPLAQIGGQKSLFDWILNYWPNFDQSNTDPGGWLASDDGSMEIADFIHLDDHTNPPNLTLVHVKGSGSDDPNRTISVSDYEVVTSQAVKNLRYLDRLLLSEGLQDGIGKMIGKLVWHDRVQSTREEMIDALSKIGANYQRRIFIFQPRLTKTSHDKARKSNQCSDFARLRQLDTLLLSAAVSCKGLGVDFRVIGSN